MCRWVRQPEGDQITPPFCKVSDKDVDKMLILVMADSLKMLGTSPFLMSLVATKNLPASSLSSTLKGQVTFVSREKVDIRLVCVL